MAKKKITVLISSAGTASAINVINGLKKQEEADVYIVAVDIDELAAGLHLADESTIVPNLKDEKYLSTLLEICLQKKVDFYFPIYSKEIEIIAEKRELFENINVKLFLPSADTIRKCNDKVYMNIVVNELGISTPRSYKLNQINRIRYPVFIKYNFSSGSSGVSKIELSDELQSIISTSRNNNLIIQEYIEAEEITVDVFCDDNSDALVVSPRIRIATKAGQAVKAKTIANDIFIDPVKKICKKLDLKGCCNIQFFRKKDELIFIEVNPRFAAGGLGLTINAGANIPFLILKQSLGLPIKKDEYQVKENVYMTRYWKEIYLNN